MGQMKRKYPVGIQTFEKIIKEKMTYVDKTKFVYKLAHGTQNNFLSRPRRFGKSLLVSTLQAYFEGRKELFKGLAIEKLETEWTKYPVIHLDLSRGKYYSAENLHGVLNMVLGICEEPYHIVPANLRDYSARLNTIIRTAVKQTGQKAVILIDEYDAPMLDSITDENLRKQIRNIMGDFFSPLKANEGIERFVFLTGITKFSQLSIFSELNNITNISMKDDYAAICGITEQEMLDNFQEGIAETAQANGMTYDEVVDKLRQQYDGYRFSANGENIYNPYSLLNAFTDKDFQNYWFSSGTPTFLLELMRDNGMLVPDLEDVMATKDQFDAPTEQVLTRLPSPTKRSGRGSTLLRSTTWLPPMADNARPLDCVSAMPCGPTTSTVPWRPCVFSSPDFPMTFISTMRKISKLLSIRSLRCLTSPYRQRHVPHRGTWTS